MRLLHKVIPAKNLYGVFGRHRKKIQPKIHMESQRILNSQTILNKKNIVVGLIFRDFKTNYKATVIKMCGSGLKADM